jgi:hypothetical protein
MVLKPRTFLALLIASMGCWLERQAAAQIEYLKAENRLLRARLGRQRLVFTDPERRTLAALAKEIGIKGTANPRSARFPGDISHLVDMLCMKTYSHIYAFHF